MIIYQTETAQKSVWSL